MFATQLQNNDDIWSKLPYLERSSSLSAVTVWSQILTVFSSGPFLRPPCGLIYQQCFQTRCDFSGVMCLFDASDQTASHIWICAQKMNFIKFCCAFRSKMMIIYRREQSTLRELRHISMILARVKLCRKHCLLQGLASLKWCVQNTDDIWPKSTYLARSLSLYAATMWSHIPTVFSNKVRF